MPTITCSCGQTLRYADKLAGKRVRCGVCLRANQTPELPEELPPPPGGLPPLLHVFRVSGWGLFLAWLVRSHFAFEWQMSDQTYVTHQTVLALSRLCLVLTTFLFVLGVDRILFFRK